MSYKSKFIKYSKKIDFIQKGGFECVICYINGNEMNDYDDLLECQNCNVVVCSNCLQRVNNKCPQENITTSWEIISKTHQD